MSTMTSTTTTHVQPRRRAAASNTAVRVVDSQSDSNTPTKDISIPKGSTFHTPKLPTSSAADPVLNIKTLPSRTLTSPEALQQLCDESEKRVNDLLASFGNLSTTTAKDFHTDYQHQDVLPVPSALVAHVAATDSGLTDPHGQTAKKSVYKPLSNPAVLLGGPTDAPPSTTGHVLSDYAAKVIKLHIIDPLLDEPTLKEFHPLVRGLPQRIGSRKITCLRDLEKTLIFLAPTKAKSSVSYLDFCEVSIQCIHTTVDHLNEIDQRRPTDRPYTNNYFVDLVEQVRAYAKIMARSRAKQAKGLPLDEDDVHPGDKIKLEGGISEDGKPIEIVRERDGRIIAIDAGYNEIDEDMLDDEVKRSMARKRKCDIGKVEYRACRECGKVYTRPCDLTKHEKTHSRPWKCSMEDCKYYELGWPTEKERDRHVNDKHSAQPALYRCLFKPCAYTSKRESNCKQHMEKAHGWDYVRSKSKKGTKLVATQGSPPTTLMPTPNSERLSTPASTTNTSNQSPAYSTYDTFSPTAESTHSGQAGSISSYQPSNTYAPSPASDLDFNNYHKAFDYGAYLSPNNSDGRRESMHSTAPSLTPASNDIPSLTFEDDFNFGKVDIDWSAMSHMFPQYNIPQQPTPAGSDFAMDFGHDAGIQDKNLGSTFPGVTMNELSPSHQAGDAALFGHSSEDLDMLMDESQGFRDFAQSRPGQQQSFHHQPTANTDFTLFGEMSGGESNVHAAAASMFPDLGDVDIGGTFNTELNAGMFDQMSDEEMDRYLYGDGN